MPHVSIRLFRLFVFYLTGALLVLAAACVAFMRKCYCLHEEYGASLNK